MNRPPDLEQRLRVHLAEEAPRHASDRVLEAALATVWSTRQERALRTPWRSFSMPGTLKLVAAPAILALALASSGLLGPRAADVGSAPIPSLSPSPSAQPIDTTGWLTFTSDRHGFSLRYPADWTTRHATAPWVRGGIDHDMPGDPATDELDLPDGGVFWLASTALPASVPVDQWLDQYARANGPVRTCWPALADWQPIAFGDLAGAYHGGLAVCDFTEAVILDGGRAYAFAAAGGADGVGDLDLFKAVLSTAVLDPASAVDTPAESPSPGPASPSPS